MFSSKMTGTKEKYINLLLKQDPELLGQEYQNQTWLPLKELKNQIRRTLCVNEFVFDIDAENWESCRELAKNLEDVFLEFGIPFFRFTSGNWLHYHVFFDPKSECPKEIWLDYFKLIGARQISIDELKLFLKELRFAVFQFIVSNVKPVDGAHFDMGIMKSERHMIRLEGEMNEKTGYYKSLLNELPRATKNNKRQCCFA
ncbi:MAG: hypothetical protein QXZ43_01830 [Candidatus Aenigmatarchaeota archaeon]